MLVKVRLVLTCFSLPSAISANLLYIFDKYRHTTRAHGEPGFGLDLAITNGISDGHGGRIHVESVVGRDTRFAIMLRSNLAAPITP